MDNQPTYHWKFDEGKGNQVTDCIGRKKGVFRGAVWPNRTGKRGRIGDIVVVSGKGKKIIFEQGVGQFGASDFTIAFGVRVYKTHGEKDMDLIGNRATKGHGNFCSVRLLNKNKIRFEVDQDQHGKNYLSVETGPIAIADNKCHHLTLVRIGQSLKIYFDGELAAQKHGKSGIANIESANLLRLGDWRRGTPGANYEDLRIYHRGLSAAEIDALVPSDNEPLKEGEVELVATDNARVVFNKDTEQLFENFQRLRVGPGTGVSLFQQQNFNGAGLKLYSDVPDVRSASFSAFPKSLQIWSAAEDPFTGNWLIRAANGRQLSHKGRVLTTAHSRTSDEYFKFLYNPKFDLPQLLPATKPAGLHTQLCIGGQAQALLMDDSEEDSSAFAIVNALGDQWLFIADDNQFYWTAEKNQRSKFYRIAKLADNQNQVGTLEAGEVALYKHVRYTGAAWVLSDTEYDCGGNYTDLSEFPGLDNQVSSLRLGPGTGVTLFANNHQAINEGQRETELEDQVENHPDLRESVQIGNDNISALQIFRTLDASSIFTAYTSTLSQDYQLVGGELKEFSAYRTIVKCAEGITELALSATDLVTIEVDGIEHEIDELRSVTVKANALGRIMITSPAEGLSTPGLKFRTPQMASNQRVIIFPDQNAHQQIAELPNDALWQGKDAKGQPIVDQQAFSQAEVAEVQKTVSRVMASAVSKNKAKTSANAAQTKLAGSETVVTAVGVDQNPWSLNFGTRSTLGQANIMSVQAPGAQSKTQSKAQAQTPKRIWQSPCSTDDFAQQLSAATPADLPEPQATVLNSPGVVSPVVDDNGFISGLPVLQVRAFRRIGRRIRDAVKKAVRVTVGFVKNVMNIVVDLGGEILSFVLDTAKKVAEFVESVVEKVVTGIRQFIEFLQFLFKWDDILATQKYLKNSINSLIDSAADIVESAKKPVAEFVANAKNTVKEGMDNLIETLGGEPGSGQGSGFELPEAAEWILCKLLGGANKSSPINIAKEAAGLPVDKTPMAQFANRLQVKQEAIDLVVEGCTGSVDAVQALIANPLKPQLAVAEIVKTIRDVLLQSMDFVGDTVLALLDVAVEGILGFKDLINGNIEIPFISALLRFIGIDKIAPLNVTTLLLAIPVTLVSKLTHGEAPFTDVAPLAVGGKSGDLAAPLSLRALAVNDAETPAQNSASAGNDDSEANKRILRGWGVTALVADTINGLITAGLDSIPETKKSSGGSSDAGSTVSDDEAGSVTAVLEPVTILLDIFSAYAGFVISDLPKPAEELNSNQSQKELARRRENQKWEQIVMGYRTAVLLADCVLMVVEIASSGPKSIERMKRFNHATTGVALAFSWLDLILNSFYLATLDDDDKRLEIPNSVVGALPDILAFLRFGGIKGCWALAAIGVTATIVTTGIGGKILANDIADL